MAASLAQEDAGVGDTLSDTYTVADTDTLVTDIDDLSVGEPLSDEEGAVSGMPAPAPSSMTAQKHLKALSDAIDAASELTTEKRASKREVTLRRLYKALSQYSTPSECGDLIEANMDENIIPACLFGITKGSSPAEQYAACRCLEALSITLGFDRDSYYEVIYEPLRRAVMATGRASPVRSAALRALTLTAFICGTDADSETSLLDLCEKACGESWRGEDVPPLLRATALDCWALISTNVDDSDLAGGDYGRGLDILPLLQQCLDHDYSELRSSAGECVTLIHEARLSLGIDAEEAANASDRRFRRGSWDGSEWEVLMDELKQRMAELAVESGHHMSKKAKKEQRSTFREFMGTVVDDEPPREVVSFRGGSLVLTSWREIIQLNFIRHCLQGGFQAQLMTNPTLLSLFGGDGMVLQDASVKQLSAIEKRLVMSKTSDAAKAADVRLARQRKNRHAAKNQFLNDD